MRVRRAIRKFKTFEEADHFITKLLNENGKKEGFHLGVRRLSDGFLVFERENDGKAKTTS